MSESPKDERDRMESTTVDGASRRSFLWKSLVTTALAAPGAAVLGSKAAQAAKAPTLPNLFPEWNARNFAELRDDEIAHVRIINSLLNDPDNNVVPPGNRPLPNFVNLLQPSAVAFAETAAAIENTGVGVYLGILQAVRPTNQGGEYFETAGEIATIEGRHTGYLNTLLDQDVVPGRVPIDSTIDQGTALERIAPFIGNLNGGPPIMNFNPTPTPGETNDFIILDFLVVLEMLEMQFYRMNVAKFFPGF
jgi:hypothetical protein